MFACPFSLQKSYPFFLSSFLSIFCVFRCFLHKKGPPPLLERKALSFISMSFFYYIRKIFLKKENTSYFKYFRKEFPSITYHCIRKSFPKKKSLRILNISEKNFLHSYISYFFFIFAAISSRSISSVRTRNGEIPCRSASLSRSAVSRS